jgi:hypothetical protein
MNLYTWKNVLKQYSYGVVIVTADTLESARRLVWVKLQGEYDYGQGEEEWAEHYAPFVEENPTCFKLDTHAGYTRHIHLWHYGGD